MPILLVDSHHASPTDVSGMLDQLISLKRPQSVIYPGRESKSPTTGTLLASQEAINQILILPDDNFRNYSYAEVYVKFRTKTRDYKDLSEEKQKHAFDAWDIDRKNPARRYLNTDSRASGFGGIGLVGRDSLYTKAMVALVEVMGTLPVIPVLQGYLFDPKAFDALEVENKNRRKEISQEDLITRYPYGILAYPKRIWPEFYSAVNGESLMRVSHHPDKVNSPHYHAFVNDPRLGELTEESTYDDVVLALRNNLLPRIERALEAEQRAFDEKYPDSK